MKPPKLYLIIFGLFIIVTGCKSNDSSVPVNTSNPPAAASPATMASPATSPPNSTATVKAKVDVCNLLTSEDLKQVQGEAFKEAQRSDRQDGEFIVAQCYYALPTTVNSVVLNVTTAKEGAGARTPKTFWEDTFGREREGKGKASERERAQKNKPKEGGEEEESAPPQKVAGLGDDAYWIASRVGGALYVLKKDQFFRISVGGVGDEKAKLNKSKTLAQQVLKKI